MFTRTFNFLDVYHYNVFINKHYFMQSKSRLKMLKKQRVPILRLLFFFFLPYIK